MSTSHQNDTLVAQGKLAEAANALIRDLEQRPSDPEILNDLGVVAFQQGKHETAISCFGRALTVDPTHPQASYNLCALLASVPLEDIETNNLYAWPFLLTRISSEDWSENDSRFLAKATSILTDTQREMLLRLTLQLNRSNSAIDATLLVESMIAVSSDLTFEIGGWIETQHVPRHLRDRLEDAICRKCSDAYAVRSVAHRVQPQRPDPDTLPVFHFYPRRLTRQFTSEDPFMKLVPEGAPAKDGLRILVMADYNIAGQLTALTRAINKYTNHAARCVIYTDDYLNYDKDIIIRDARNMLSEASLEEAASLVRQADFFHFGRQLLDLPGIEWNRYISPRNAVFQYYGSELRDNGPALAEFHQKTGLPAISACDYTMYRLLPASFYHIQPYMLEMDQLPQAGMDTSGKLRVCHAPSSQNYRNIKKSNVIMSVMKQLAAEDPRIEAIEITSVPNRQCLEIKSTCHIHIVSLLFTFGLNTIESAAMGLVPITPLDNFSMLLYPDTPVIHATPTTLYEVTKKLLGDPERLKETGQACQAWARREFDARLLVQKYWYLYDLIYHGFSLDYPDTFVDRARYPK